MLDKENVLASLIAHREALQKLGVRRIGLFGSTARGEATANSDVDFVVELKAKTFDAYMDVKEYLEQLFARRVDLVLADGIKPLLRERILQETIHAPGY